MKRSIKTMVASALAIVLTVAVISPTVFASGIMPMTDYQSADYAIPMGGGTWNGKTEGHLWTLTKNSTVFNISVTSTTDKTVWGSLYRVVTLAPDTKIISIEKFTESNNGWRPSAAFVPSNTTSSYYATVTSADSLGVEGRVSVN